MEGIRILFITLAMCAGLLATLVESACEDEQWVMIDDTLLEIHNDLTLTDQDNADECKRVCMEQETNFTCRSLEYSTAESTCHLSKASRSTHGITMRTTPGVTYYELFCADEESVMNDAMEYFTDHPAYVVIYGLGGLCLLLVIVAVVIIVTSPARSKTKVID